MIETAIEEPPVEAGAIIGRARVVGLPLGLALGAIVVTYWTIDIVSPALPDLKDDLRISSASVGLLYSLLFLGRLLGNFPAGVLLDRAGTATTSTLGALIVMCGTGLASIAPDALLLAPARVIQGIGIALLVNAGLRAILGARPGRGAAMTYFGIAATLGGVFGLESGGFLTDHYGWRAVFVLGAVLGGVIAVTTLAARFLAAAQAIPVATAETTRTDAISLAGPLFAPLIYNFLIFVNYSVFVALPLYTEHHFGSSPEANARLLMVITVTHVLAAVPAGRAIRRWGSQWALVAGIAIALAGTILVLPMPSSLLIGLPLVLYGVGQITGSNACGDIVLHLGRQSTKAIGYLRFSSDLGIVVGPYATGKLADHFGYGAPFVALTAMMALTALAALWQGERVDADRL